MKLETARKKIFPKEELKHLMNVWRLKSNEIVFTNGCFDILHTGHMQLLSTAADMGGKLIVGLNSDRSVRALKGETRPINNENDRALLLASLFYVDAIVIFDEDTPFEILQYLQPDVLVKGGDYTKKDIVGAELIENAGGRVAIVPLVEGYSTTRISTRLK